MFRRLIILFMILCICQIGYCKKVSDLTTLSSVDGDETFHVVDGGADYKITLQQATDFWLTTNATVSTASYSTNSDKLDGQHGSYYSDVTNHTGTIPTSNLHSTVTRLGQTIEASEISEAVSNAQNLDGQSGSYYRNVANATGTLPNANLPQNISISGTVTANAFKGDGSGLTGLAAAEDAVTNNYTGDVSITGTVTVNGSFRATTINADDIKAGDLNQSYLESGIDSAKIGAGGVNNTKHGYLANLSSDVQTQLNSKISADTDQTISANYTFGSGDTTQMEIGGGRVTFNVPIILPRFDSLVDAPTSAMLIYLNTTGKGYIYNGVTSTWNVVN